MANRKRDVQILLWVTPEEKKMIRKRMILSKTSNMSVYLRKMAIDGHDCQYRYHLFESNVSGNAQDWCEHQPACQSCKHRRYCHTARYRRAERNGEKDMAYIKIFPIKSTVKKTVAYITNPDKTDEQNLVSSFGCSPETADLEFAMTAEMGKNNVMEKGDNLAWHMIISYHPNDLTAPKLAHEVSTKIADSVLKGKYEYVLTTHTDKKHIHSVRPDRAMRKAV